MGGVAALVLSLLVAAASAMLTLHHDGLYCDRLPSITVLATLSAFLLALCFRLLPRHRAAPILIALVVSALCLFADAHFVVHYRGLCHGLQQQLH